MIRLIADENISWRIKRSLDKWHILPVNEMPGNKPLTDFQIWNYAKANNYSILTFDEDFIDLLNIYAFPPKVIWLRMGNVNASFISARLTKMEQAIKDFILDQELGVYEIYL